MSILTKKLDIRREVVIFWFHKMYIIHNIYNTNEYKTNEVKINSSYIFFWLFMSNKVHINFKRLP